MWDDPVCIWCGNKKYYNNMLPCNCCSACTHLRIPEDVQTELNDPEYLNRTHGKRSTYGAGCHGPLCRKSERDHSHAKYAARQARAGARPARIGLRDDDIRSRDLTLRTIQGWHELRRELAKLNRLVQPAEPEEGIAS